MTQPDSDRYSRQERFAPIGKAGQEKLRNSHVLVCGCGALGSVIANSLVRAGVGRLRIVDRDFLEMNNLQRQVLYDEADVNARDLGVQIAACDRAALDGWRRYAEGDYEAAESLCRRAIDARVDGDRAFRVLLGVLAEPPTHGAFIRADASLRDASGPILSRSASTFGGGGNT